MLNIIIILYTLFAGILSMNCLSLEPSIRGWNHCYAKDNGYTSTAGERKSLLRMGIPQVFLGDCNIISEIIKKNSFHDSTELVTCKTKGGLRVESMKCFGSSEYLNCKKPLPVGTLVLFKCPKYYTASYKTSKCKNDGNWTVPIKCNPECGSVAPSPAAVALVMHGQTATLGQFPWVAALYFLIDGQWSYSCGGTLIADNAVITAAHCTWNMKKENMLVALGLISRSLPDEHKHVYRIKRVFVLPVFREATNYYNSDIAILVLESPAELSENIFPACLPNTNPASNASVTPFTEGVVAGWGTNENREQPENLQYMKVPIIDTVRCMKSVPQQFTKFMAFTSFCAGYTNGTGACNGDSGNGLVTESNGRWVLQGVVSISPRRGTSRFCHPRNYSLYTKVMLYLDWILKVLAFEDNKTLDHD